MSSTWEESNNDEGQMLPGETTAGGSCCPNISVGRWLSLPASTSSMITHGCLLLTHSNCK
jgi:hypothetical protein